MTLLDALGAAKEGSRELDCAILVETHCGWKPRYQYLGVVFMEARGDGSVDVIVRGKDGKEQRVERINPLPFSTSIDAALQLVPTGPEIRWNLSLPTSGKPWARIWLCETGEQLASEYAETFALALTIAALRARAAHDSTEER